MADTVKPQDPNTYDAYTQMINSYNQKMSSVMTAMIYMSSHYSAMNPGDFLMLQFILGQVTQIGDSISNLISTVNSTISNTVRNMKG